MSANRRTISDARVSRSTLDKAAGTQVSTALRAWFFGTVASPAITGTGALAEQVTTASAAGASASVGNGALADAVSVVAGAGVSGSSGTGALVDQGTAASATGLSLSVATESDNRSEEHTSER